MAVETFILSGDVNVEITITELADGSLQFDLKVLNDTGSIGDLNAFFFDLADDSLTTGLIIEGADVTDTALKVDGVTKVDSYTNMNGEVVKELGKFDGGVQFGTQGIGTDDIRETSFTLSHDTVDLSLADFSIQDFGVRLTSVGEEGGAREDSLKIGGTSPEFIEDPTGPGNTAIDDTMSVNQNETFSSEGQPLDYLADFAASVLANDNSDTMPYLGDVVSVNGEAADVGQVVLGSNGGSARIYADGSVDFSASSFDGGLGDFDYLGDGQSAQTTFEYGIDGGSSATLVVTVNGPGGDGGPIDPLPPFSDFG